MTKKLTFEYLQEHLGNRNGSARSAIRANSEVIIMGINAGMTRRHIFRSLVELDLISCTENTFSTALSASGILDSDQKQAHQPASTHRSIPDERPKKSFREKQKIEDDQNDVDLQAALEKRKKLNRK